MRVSFKTVISISILVLSSGALAGSEEGDVVPYSIEVNKQTGEITSHEIEPGSELYEELGLEEGKRPKEYSRQKWANVLMRFSANAGAQTLANFFAPGIGLAESVKIGLVWGTGSAGTQAINEWLQGFIAPGESAINRLARHVYNGNATSPQGAAFTHGFRKVADLGLERLPKSTIDPQTGEKTTKAGSIEWISKKVYLVENFLRSAVYEGVYLGATTAMLMNITGEQFNALMFMGALATGLQAQTPFEIGLANRRNRQIERAASQAEVHEIKMGNNRYVAAFSVATNLAMSGMVLGQKALASAGPVGEALYIGANALVVLGISAVGWSNWIIDRIEDKYQISFEEARKLYFQKLRAGRDAIAGTAKKIVGAGVRITVLPAEALYEFAKSYTPKAYYEEKPSGSKSQGRRPSQTRAPVMGCAGFF